MATCSIPHISVEIVIGQSWHVLEHVNIRMLLLLLFKVWFFAVLVPKVSSDP